MDPARRLHANDLDAGTLLAEFKPVMNHSILYILILLVAFQASASVGVAVSSAMKAKVAAAASSVYASVGNEVMDTHVSIDETLANLYSGKCPVRPGTNPRTEAALEKKYFPFAAKKMIHFNVCEASILEKIESSKDGDGFKRKVIDDIAMKLPTMRKLYTLIKALKHRLDGFQSEQFALDAQRARVGYVDPGQLAEEKVRGRHMAALGKNLQAVMKAQKALIETVWRGKDKVMGDYLVALTKSTTPVSVFKREALAKNPSRPQSFFEDTFSFKDAVLTPMIDESHKIVKKLNGEYVTTADGKRVFDPGFGVRNILVDNMDLVTEVDDGPPVIKDLQCHLDYKYAKGDDDFGTTISVLTMLTGPAIKGFSLALKATKLEKFVAESAIVQKLGGGFSGGAGAYGFAMTAESAVDACRSSLEQFDDGKTSCDARTSAKDLSKFEERQLDKGNCGLMIVSSVLTETGVSQIGKRLSSIFAANPGLQTQIVTAQEKAVQALKLKDKEQVIQNNGETAKDVKDIVSPPKDDDDDKDADTGKDSDDSKDDGPDDGK